MWKCTLTFVIYVIYDRICGMLIPVFVRIVLYGCWNAIDRKEVWWEGKCGGGSYVSIFKMASKILLGKIVCLSLSWLSVATSL